MLYPNMSYTYGDGITYLKCFSNHKVPVLKSNSSYLLFKSRGKKGNIHFEFSILIYELCNKLFINILNHKKRL